MTEKVYVVTDLGPGDGGKGGVVHKIATMRRAHTVIKVGGAQGSHGVRTSRGDTFAFSQWGCGTFEGIQTHLSSRFIVTPIGLLNEADALRYKYGIHNAFDLLTVDESALCATPYHGIASRLKEMARRNNPRGTIGTGVGETYRYSQRYPELTIQVRDLTKPDIKEQLATVREKVQECLEETIQSKFLASDSEAAEEEIYLLHNDGFLEHNAKRFRELSRLVRMVDCDYLGRGLAKDGVAVVESSHGVLTDHYQGFYPHVSAIRTLPVFANDMLRDAGFAGEIVNIGVTRAYSIRHGAGPMPTDDPRMRETLLPGSHKVENRYQGEARVGPLDLTLLRYAIEVCGPKWFDGLAVTWFDQIQRNGEWKICENYIGADLRVFFSSLGAINVRHGEDHDQLEFQKELGRQLNRCIPQITKIAIPPEKNREKLFEFCAKVLNDKAGVPVRMVSFGPTELDKICK